MLKNYPQPGTEVRVLTTDTLRKLSYGRSAVLRRALHVRTGVERPDDLFEIELPDGSRIQVKRSEIE